MLDELLDENFEIVQHVRVQDVWDSLMSQTPLSSTSLDRNIEISKNAWQKANLNWKKDAFHSQHNQSSSLLNDSALRRWIAAYLLNTEF